VSLRARHDGRGAAKPEHEPGPKGSEVECGAIYWNGLVLNRSERSAP